MSLQDNNVLQLAAVAVGAVVAPESIYIQLNCCCSCCSCSEKNVFKPFNDYLLIRILNRMLKQIIIIALGGNSQNF